MRVFITKWFARFARKEGISAEKLVAAIREAENGLNDGELGGGLIKSALLVPGLVNAADIERSLSIVSKNGRFSSMASPKV